MRAKRSNRILLEIQAFHVICPMCVPILVDLQPHAYPRGTKHFGLAVDAAMACPRCHREWQMLIVSPEGSSYVNPFHTLL